MHLQYRPGKRWELRLSDRKSWQRREGFIEYRSRRHVGCSGGPGAVTEEVQSSFLESRSDGLVGSASVRVEIETESTIRKKERVLGYRDEAPLSDYAQRQRAQVDSVHLNLTLLYIEKAEQAG